MRGKKTDGKMIDEIAELLKLHRPADVVTMTATRVPRRTVYRIIAKLKAENERRKLEEAERFQQSMQRRTMSQLEYLESRKRFKKVSDFPPNLRRVRSY